VELVATKLADFYLFLFFNLSREKFCRIRIFALLCTAFVGRTSNSVIHKEVLFDRIINRQTRMFVVRREVCKVSFD
jgi:hypothetical protein